MTYYGYLRNCTHCETAYKERCPVKGSRGVFNPGKKTTNEPWNLYFCPSCLLSTYPEAEKYRRQVNRYKTIGRACNRCPNLAKCLTIEVV